ncbi:MAG: hypothetical protein C7B47_07725 [Sulfobacillus thermosulfidooxidans]|uniref:Uncharacterized protein n=1 Tax=Sulfobacillus thermosulfidooxidans TaxID=28034 RepID=A0A2T2WYX8_SULTH|nr:MAG: hypothetical protein C7B47_07725 [Sulfobacillus thermosulfidooxidans]
MFLLATFTFWIAGSILMMTGFGREVFDRHQLRGARIGLVMLITSVLAIITATFYPFHQANFGNIAWEAFMGSVFLLRGRSRLWWETFIIAVMITVVRGFGPINPHHADVVNWAVWESVMTGVFIGSIIHDPFYSALSAGMAAIQSGIILTLLAGHIHFGTTRDMAFVLSSTLIAWHMSWIMNWIHTERRAEMSNS